MLAQGQSSSAKRGGLAAVSSGLISSKKEKAHIWIKFQKPKSTEKNLKSARRKILLEKTENQFTFPFSLITLASKETTEQHFQVLKENSFELVIFCPRKLAFECERRYF